MPPEILTALQDTTVVALARDGLATFTAWAMGGLLVAFVVLVVVVLLVLAELRRLSAAWTDFLATTVARSESLVASATSAARNIDHISGTVRDEVDRLGASFGGLAGGLEHASVQVQQRLKDLIALVDLAQSEAEDAVLEAASSVRALRANAAGFLLSQLRRNPRTATPAEDGVQEGDGVAETAAPEGGTPSARDQTAQK